MRSRTVTRALLAPATLWFLGLLVLPLVVILVFSFGERAPAGGYAPGFTLEQYANLPSRLTAFQNTLLLAPLGTLAALAFAYPLAYFLALTADPRWRTTLLILVVVPFWTSILIRTYAWMFLLGGRGLPALLELVGIGNVRLINTSFAVLVGIVYGYLPLMVFPIYVSLEKLDTRLLEASADLGATPFATFRQVTLPMSLPGVATGCMLVFILLMGEFLIPALLGGGKVFFVGNALVDLFLQSRNWPFGSAVATALVAIMLVTVTLYMRLALRGSGQRGDVGMFLSPVRLYVAAVYLFLYVPIGIIVLFSFSAGRNASSFEGFSTQWYGRAFANPFVLDALRTSLTVAFVTAVLASLFGTMAALALQDVRGRLRALYDATIYVAIMIPGIVIGIATLVALVTVFDLVNPLIAAAWPGEAPLRLGMGLGSLIAAHTLFTMALVIVIVRARIAGMDRALIEASQDLYATPWATFWQVTFPQLLPAILAGFLLSFTFSFDDFIIAFFVAGSETTLPIYIFSSIRRGVTPEINAIGTAVLAVSLTLLIAAQLLLRRRARRTAG